MKSVVVAFVLLFIGGGLQAQNDPGMTPGDTGTISFTYQGVPVTYTTVRAADGKVWLQQNLGSLQVGGYASDSAAYGHYFQWGRWDDGHQLPSSPMAPVSNVFPRSPAGILNGSDTFYYDILYVQDSFCQWWEDGDSTDTWSAAPPSDSNGSDPCAVIGPGWHMPTQPEFENVILLEGITDTASAFSSNLKLPLAGQRRFDTDGFLYQGEHFLYWTSNTFDSLGVAVSYYYWNTSVNVYSKPYRAYGASVRCVTECTGVYPPDSISGPDSVCVGMAQVWSTPGSVYASHYLWTVPSGWTIIGPDTGSSITVVPGPGAGQIMVRATNMCDTSVAYAMDVQLYPSPQAQVTQYGLLLSAPGNYPGYQWLLNGVVIPGAVHDTLEASADGGYQVVVTNSYGCTDTSGVQVVSLGVAALQPGGDIRVFPNPTRGVLHISVPAAVDVRLYNATGALVLKKEQVRYVELEGLPAGFYQVELRSDSGEVLKRERVMVMQQ
ncbi:MAG: T9SS type A sorting domain-containing protein [Flavipsychrobacter sp.]|nr:T9SS type A sorting domain-containing protein [Flavipsychrobacter sp.]